MAEFVMKDLVKKAGLEAWFHIESAATSTEEIGNPVYPPAVRELEKHGISCEGKRARQLIESDYDSYDMLIGMDSANIRNIERMTGHKKGDKIYKMMEFADSSRDVADPWYTGDFDKTYRDILEGCRGLLKYLKGRGMI